MLEFECVAKAQDTDIAVYVFYDPDRGHTVYASHTGTLVVVEKDRSHSGKVRAAGFTLEDNSCSGCDGC